MSASQNQSSLNSAPAVGAGTKFNPSTGSSSDSATPAMSVGSATAFGHGDHPKDNADDSNAVKSGSKVGPQQEDLDGEQMRAPGEGEVFRKQLDKKQEGWGEEGSYTDGLERMKEEQKEKREEIKEQRREGGSGAVDGGAGGRVSNEGLSSV
ncbi:uncharacterized protein RCO7_04738 [Rhynchosporium graminicola]|uniref:Uncharacterized protein n=1 Tax=Rhynchosporium graminicola TaxID=2792576 RepID=A0A1E1JTT3_9HELO|nr:uncharacterized protein RCO7_04738 [Rhynchosporium commune]